MKAIGCITIVLCCMLTGCTSYVAHDFPEAKLANYRQFFVKANFDDNHGMAGRIADALRDRGLKADQGPMTLMPQSAQAVISYKERWAWDFRTHLAALDIVIRDTRSDKVIGDASFSGSTSMLSSPDEIIDRLLDAIFSPKKSKSSSTKKA